MLDGGGSVAAIGTGSGTNCMPGGPLGLGSVVGPASRSADGAPDGRDAMFGARQDPAEAPEAAARREFGNEKKRGSLYR